MADVQVRVRTSASYPRAAQRVDSLLLRDLEDWETDYGAVHLGRPDALDLPGPAGYDAQWNNKLPNGTAVARVADTVAGTVTLPTPDVNILAGRQTALVSQHDDMKALLSETPLTATGAFWGYVAVHILVEDVFRVAGNTAANKLMVTVTNALITLAIASGVSLSTVADPDGVLRLKDLLIGFFRMTDGHLRLRYKKRGVPWIQATSVGTHSNSIDTNFSFLAANVEAGKTPYGHWGQWVIGTGDITLLDEYPADVGLAQNDIERQMEGYFRMR